MQSRDDFNKETKRVLQTRVGNKCSNPHCRTPTSGPNNYDNKATTIGVAAHITAASPGGPRYDSNLTTEQRKSINNGIWLCQNCAWMIDADHDCYTTNTLCDWKQIAEDKARQELKGKYQETTYTEEDNLECPYCGTLSRHGLTVCKGCLADIVYGATQEEQNQAMGIGFIIAIGMSMIIFVAIPDKLNKQFEWDISIAWGLGWISVILTILIAFFAGAYALDRKENEKASLVRFFRKQ